MKRLQKMIDSKHKGVCSWTCEQSLSCERNTWEFTLLAREIEDHDLTEIVTSLKGVVGVDLNIIY